MAISLCPVCLGTGKDYHIKTDPCHRCGGVGTINNAKKGKPSILAAFIFIAALIFLLRDCV